MARGAKVLIVESPTKARTIERFVDRDILVKSTFGHIRDLPKHRLGIARRTFIPSYVIPKRTAPVVKELKGAVEGAEAVYLATDPDREGEAIAWHVSEVLDLKGKGRPHPYRVTFHEITQGAVRRALDHPGAINLHLVEAQQARRVLDRLVGYELSPLLWEKIYRGLSAGRVQSAALRLIVDREEEIAHFRAKEYWSLTATFATKAGDEFLAKLTHLKGRPLPKYPSQAAIAQAQGEKAKSGWEITTLAKEREKRHPPAPFTTSTLQQEANRQLRYSAKQTMLYAQRLYEGVTLGQETVGLITYMRTDSPTMAAPALSQARAVITKKYGPKFLPSAPRQYKARTKGAQEAHEAIRPTDFSREPGKVKGYLSPQEYKLYNLIWQRALASQMASAEVEITRLEVALARKLAAVTYSATGLTVLFPGFRTLYKETSEEKEEAGQILPHLTKGQAVTLRNLAPAQHFTQPPPRYTEAGLIREMEKRGIGRPSTYAPTVGTLVGRRYVIREDHHFVPQEVGKIVIQLLKEKFPTIVDLDFTAEMEDELDEIAQGKKKWQPVIRAFYEPFKKLLARAEVSIEDKSLSETPTDEHCPECKKALIIKLGPYGRFYACTGFPKCRYTRPLDQAVLKPGGESGERAVKGKCPKDGGELITRRGRFGPFIGCTNYPKCHYIASLNQEIGLACPTDGGEIVEKRTRRGRVFWACANYPKCRFASWDKPTADRCGKCQGVIVERAGRKFCPACLPAKAGKAKVRP